MFVSKEYYNLSGDEVWAIGHSLRYKNTLDLAGGVIRAWDRKHSEQLRQRIILENTLQKTVQEENYPSNSESVYEIAFSRRDRKLTRQALGFVLEHADVIVKHETSKAFGLGALPGVFYSAETREQVTARANSKVAQLVEQAQILQATFLPNDSALLNTAMVS